MAHHKEAGRGSGSSPSGGTGAITPDGEHEAAEMVAAALLAFTGVDWTARVSHTTLAPIVLVTARDGRRYQLICTEDITPATPPRKDTGDAHQAPAGESTPDENVAGINCGCGHSSAVHNPGCNWCGCAHYHRKFRPVGALDAPTVPVECRTGLCEHPEHWGSLMTPQQEEEAHVSVSGPERPAIDTDPRKGAPTPDGGDWRTRWWQHYEGCPLHDDRDEGNPAGPCRCGKIEKDTFNRNG